MASSVTEQIAIRAVANLTAPLKLATLAGDNACNRRLNQCAYWMRRAEMEGIDVRVLVKRAVATYQDSPEHRKLVVKTLLICHRRMARSGCYTAANLVHLRKGESAIITRGKYVGQTMEVDHIVPKSLVPALAKDFANLRFQPFVVNRAKSDRVSDHQLRAVRIFARAGLIAESAVPALSEIAFKNVSAREVRQELPGTAAHLATLAHAPSFGLNAIDPRDIVRRIDQLRERIRDWEPRADSAVSAAELFQRQTAEHVDRIGSLLRQAQTRAQDDTHTVRQIENEMEQWRERGAAEMARAWQSVERARAAGNRARQSIQHWKYELKYAEVWEQRAEHRVNRAQAQVDRAEAALSNAREALSRAEEALERARNRTRVVGRDSDGKKIREPIDTTPFENKVEAAQERVNRCEEFLERANDELDSASAEHDAAQARVASCESAIATATKAEASANTGQRRAREAVAAVERASEEHSRAARWVTEANEALKHGERTILAMTKRTEAANERERDGEDSLRICQKNHSTARLHSTRGCMEMTWRHEQLQAFDRPISEF